MTLRLPNLCLIGNMLGRNPGFVTTQGQIIGDLFASEGYKVISISSRINRFARFVEILGTLLIRRRSFDVIILEIYSGPYFLIPNAVSRLCKIFGLPLIAVLHGGELPTFIRRFPRWTSRVLTQADALVAPSYFLAKDIESLGYQVQVIPNVIDLEQYPYRERGHIEPNIIWMRSFHHIYNPEMAIEVLAKLRESEPKATLTMAGRDKGLEGNLRFLAKEKGVSEYVRFVGFLDFDTKVKEMNAADVYINTNRTDNMPVSLVEARAMGLPVVATMVGGIPYMIEDGRNGFLVPNEDTKSMVEKIKRLLADPEITLRISKNGRFEAEGSAWHSVRPTWEKLIATVVKRTDEIRFNSEGWKSVPNRGRKKL